MSHINEHSLKLSDANPRPSNLLLLQHSLLLLQLMPSMYAEKVEWAIVEFIGFFGHYLLPQHSQFTIRTCGCLRENKVGVSEWLRRQHSRFAAHVFYRRWSR